MRVLLTGADGALGVVVDQTFRTAGDKVAALHGRLDVDDADAGVFAAGDLRDPAAAQAVVRRAVAWTGRLDAVVHLVGAFAWRPLVEAPVEIWRDLFSANLETAVSVAQATLPHMGDGGAIVMIGAHAAQPAGAGFGPYGAAKAGVARLVEALAAELRPRRIRVNAVLPSIIDTPQNRREMPEVDAANWTSPAAIAAAIRFLASDDSRAITGALIPVTNPG